MHRREQGRDRGGRPPGVRSRRAGPGGRRQLSPERRGIRRHRQRVQGASYQARSRRRRRRRAAAAGHRLGPDQPLLDRLAANQAERHRDDRPRPTRARSDRPAGPAPDSAPLGRRQDADGRADPAQRGRGWEGAAEDQALPQGAVDPEPKATPAGEPAHQVHADRRPRARADPQGDPAASESAPLGAGAGQHHELEHRDQRG